MIARLNFVLLALLVASAIGLVTSRHQSRKLFIELEREQDRGRQFDVEWGQLQLEQSTWATPARIEKIAREQLHMQAPGPSRVQVVSEPRKQASAQ